MDAAPRNPVLVYLQPKMAVLLALGFSAGVPLGLVTATLQAWATDAGVDLGTIGLIGFVGLPYSLKFLWSPVMDRFGVPGLGRRRGWLLATQAALIVGIAAMAAAGMGSLAALSVIALAVAFFSASQDIVVDAYRTDVLDDRERGAGAAVYVTGYRFAYLLATGATLVLAGRYDWSWREIYLAMAGAMLVGVAATLLGREPESGGEPPQTMKDAVLRPFGQFLRRRDAVAVLAFVVLFKAPDEMLNAMRIPLLHREIGYAMEQIGAIAQTLGMAMSILGTLLGGGVVARLGLWRSMWVFAVLQAVSNLGFLALLGVEPSDAALAAVVCVENVCGGMVAAGFVAFLMAQCDARFSATQYALLSSLMAVTRAVAAGPSGYLVEWLGWPIFIALTVAAIAPAMALLPWLTVPAATATTAEAEPPPGAQSSSTTSL